MAEDQTTPVLKHVDADKAACSLAFKASHDGQGESIEFIAGNTTMMSFQSDGQVTVRGEVIEKNSDVFRHFRAWLHQAELVL